MLLLYFRSYYSTKTICSFAFFVFFFVFMALVLTCLLLGLLSELHLIITPKSYVEHSNIFTLNSHGITIFNVNRARLWSKFVVKISTNYPSLWLETWRNIDTNLRYSFINLVLKNYEKENFLLKTQNIVKKFPSRFPKIHWEKWRKKIEISRRAL